MKTHYFRKMPLPTAPRPHRPDGVPRALSILSDTRADIRHVLRGPRLQAKLTIGARNDIYEQEADRVADAVMRVPDSQTQAAGACEAAACPRVEEETIQSKPLSDRIAPLVLRQIEEQEEELRQTKQGAGPAPEATPQVAAEIASMQGGGQPLPAAERAFFEPRFGHDFSQVRIHAGTEATKSTRDLNAKAYTFGHNIVFARNQFIPGTAEGKRLIAHELSHVVQQNNGGKVLVQRQFPLGVSTAEGQLLPAPKPEDGALGLPQPDCATPVVLQRNLFYRLFC